MNETNNVKTTSIKSRFKIFILDAKVKKTLTFSWRRTLNSKVALQKRTLLNYTFIQVLS